MNFETAEKPCSAPEQAEMMPVFKNSMDAVRPMNDICELQCNMAEGMHCRESSVMQRDVTDVPVEELKPCCGFCCNLCSLFCGCPSCIGCNGHCTLLFCQAKYVYCKVLDCKDADSRCCACCIQNCYLVAPRKFYECGGQYFCIDCRAAFPCTRNVPCIMAAAGFTCCADFKCQGCTFMPRLGDIIPRLDERAGKSTRSTIA